MPDLSFFAPTPFGCIFCARSVIFCANRHKKCMVSEIPVLMHILCAIRLHFLCQPPTFAASRASFFAPNRCLAREVSFFVPTGSRDYIFCANRVSRLAREMHFLRQRDGCLARWHFLRQGKCGRLHFLCQLNFLCPTWLAG